jgi:hypothetical protein
VRYISLSVKNASIGKLCQNGKLILFSTTYSDETPIFVDLNNQEVIYSPYKYNTFAQKIINEKSGDVWIWDPISKETWKFSSHSKTLMGYLESGHGTALAHVDKNDSLYLVDQPF